MRAGGRNEQRGQSRKRVPERDVRRPTLCRRHVLDQSTKRQDVREQTVGDRLAVWHRAVCIDVPDVRSHALTLTRATRFARSLVRS